MTWKTVLQQMIAGSVRRVHSWATTFKRGALLAPTDRREFLKTISNGPCLEIGPFDAPLLRGNDVKYFDILDQEGLRVRAVEHARDPAGCPYIDYVSPHGNFGIINDKFRVILSAHVIEHQPDLVRHLNDISAILLPGGSYYLLIPDRRFCFDYFLPESTYQDVLDGVGRKFHTPRAVENHFLFTTHNNALSHWLGRHGPKPRRMLTEAVANECRRASDGEYVDVHAWFFTPTSFAAIMQKLKDEGLISLSIERIHETAFGKLEFFAVLRSSAA